MNREQFLTSIVAAALAPQAIGDPETAAPGQALRVLLGRGHAQQIDAQSFEYEGRTYRGSFSALPDGSIVNLVPLEAYLYSVVPREMPRSWPAAALQAQAILARTYVLGRSSPLREYDLVPSESDQVYTGIDAEHAQTSDAVDATRGTVLRYGGGFASISYSSCCGGHTESNADAWGGKPLPYCKGVPCTYCSQSPWYSWSKTIEMAQLERALQAQLSAAGPIAGVQLQQPDESGRPRTWTFVGSDGTIEVNAKDVRRTLGSRVLPSLLVRSVAIEAAADGGSMTVEGGGLGHGVGLCQWGARGMALAGAQSRAILAYYFPGTITAND